LAQKQRATAKKVKDKWRAKEWYKLLAPDMFSRMMLGETPADSPEGIMGRTTVATVQDLLGDFSKMHVKLKFKVHDVRGYDAYTIFAGHDLTSDYVRRLTRRKRTKTDTVADVVTKDGWEVRIKPMAVSEQRIQASQETAIRNIMQSELKRVASEVTIGELVRMIIMGELARKLSDASKIIVPIKRIEVRKSEVTRAGRMPEPGEEPIIGGPQSEEAPPEAETQPAQPAETAEAKPAEAQETPAEAPAEEELPPEEREQAGTPPAEDEEKQE